MVRSGPVAEVNAVSRRPLRRARRPARVARRASLRRHLAGRARRSSASPEPAQRRPPDAARRRERGRPDLARLARATATLVDEPSRASGGSRRTTSARTGSRARARASSRRSRPSRTRTGSSSRTSAHTARPKGGPAAPAARGRAPSSSRSSSSTRAGRRPDGPTGEPDLEVEGARLWRLAGRTRIAEAFADRQLLIADGHHRYETALAYHERAGTRERLRARRARQSSTTPA